MGFFVANLSDAEAKKLAQNPNVEAVEDDIRVYAMCGGIGVEYPDDISLRGSDPQLDDEDIEALAADPYPQFGPDEVPVSRENVQLGAQLTPDIGEDLEFDEFGSRLILCADGSHGGVAPDLAKCHAKNLSHC